MSGQRIVVVGASVGGTTVAFQLRQQGFTGQIKLIGDEPHLPYDRPPLSKQLLKGTFDPNDLTLQSRTEFEEHKIELLLGSPAVRLDTRAKQVELTDETTVEYDVLIIATGVRANRIDATDRPGILYLRTLEEALELKRRLVPGMRLGVVGAGLIGLEAAAVAVELGCTAEIIEPKATPLGDHLGADVGLRIQELHEQHGVRFHLGRAVENISQTTDDKYEIDVGDGQDVRCDTVLVGIGTTPNSEWLTDRSIDTRNGVVCDQYCRAGEDVYAIGDIANVFDARSGRHRRVEHRAVPPEHAYIVARNIVGHKESMQAVTSFWSDQYDVRIHMLGAPSIDAETRLAEENDSGARFVIHFVKDGTIEAVLGWNAAKMLNRHRKFVPGGVRP